MSTMEPLVLKKSCDACTNSKVKCSGGLPCERCVGKGVQCYFSPRKRRTKPKKPKTDGPEGERSMYAFDPKTPLGSLVEWERRSWSVFFTLYKHYGTSCSLHWFNKQLNKMRNYLSRQGNEESLRRLTSWMTALNIDVDSLAAEVERCRVKCYENRSTLTLNVPGKVNGYQDTRMTARLTESSSRVPFLRLTSQYPNGSMRDEEEEVSIECNEAFSKVFGIHQRALEEQLRWTGGGFLPWGGDILARILTKEKDVLAFVQILAIKFNTLGRPKTMPCVRDVPSCHMFEVNIKEKANTGALMPVNALIKCMHREVLSNDQCSLEISMEFTPLAPHEHLLSSMSSISNSEELNEEPETDVLTVKREVVPFSTNGKKRSHPNFAFDESKSNFNLPLQQMPSFDNLAVLDDFDLDPFTGTANLNPVPVSVGSRSPSAMSSFSTMMTANDRFTSKQDSLNDVIEQGLTEFNTHTHSNSSHHRLHQPVYKPDFNNQITNLPPVSVVNGNGEMEEQSEWLDGLLDWANKQDLVTNK